MNAAEAAIELARLRADLALAKDERRRAGRALERAKRRRIATPWHVERASAAKRAVTALQRRINEIDALNAALRGRRPDASTR